MFLFQIIGEAFLYFPRYVSIVRRYVVGGVAENDMDVVEQDEQENARFVSETKSLMYLCRSANITADFKENFWDFHDFTFNCGLPMGSVLVSERQVCRRCNKALIVEGKPHVVVIYHIFWGTYLGTRITKEMSKVQNIRALWFLNRGRQTLF